MTQLLSCHGNSTRKSVLFVAADLILVEEENMSKIEASPRQVEQTRRLYANLITSNKPLDGRQLARPPFKFIQELVKSLIKETRILRDVFRPQDFNSIASMGSQEQRRTKEAFVQRLIEFVASHGLPVVNCVAARVIAGLEPNKTHELLQNLAKIAHQHRSNLQTRRPQTFTKTGESLASSAKLDSVSDPADPAATLVGDSREEITKQQGGRKEQPVINQAPVSPERQQNSELKLEQTIAKANNNQMRLATSESDIAKNMLHVRSRLSKLRSAMEQLVGWQWRLEQSLRQRVDLCM